jgi:hypothetical protein
MTSIAISAAVGLFVVILIMVWMRRRSVQTFETVYADDKIPVKDHPF